LEHRHLLPDEIDLLLDGEAGFGVQPLQAHVRRCALCRAELEAARAVTAELESLPHFAPSPLFTERVMARVQLFEPTHVAAMDTVRRFVPQSRPARVLAGAAAVSMAAVLSVAAIWLGANADSLFFLADTASERGRSAVAAAFGRLVAGAFGEPALDALSGGGIAGIAVALTALLAVVLVAAFGLRAVAGASRRQRS
jgi:hypothetical protein